jgi:hypothetical protein
MKFLAAPLLQRFLPITLTIVLKEEGADKMLNLFDGESDTPELIWESSMRGDLRNVVGRLLDVCIDERQKAASGNEVFVLDPSTRVTYKTLNDELFIGGVYVSRFLKEPTYNLRDPTRFLEMLLQRWAHELQQVTKDDFNSSAPQAESTALTVGGTDTLLSVTNASVYVCKVRSNLNEKLSQWGYMSRCLTFLDSILAVGLFGTPLLSIMRILHVAVNSRPNIENLILSGKNDRSHGIVALTMRAVEADELHKDTSFMLEMMKKLFVGALGNVNAPKNPSDLPRHAYAMAPSPAPGDGPVSRNRVARGNPLDDPLALPPASAPASAQVFVNPGQYQNPMQVSSQYSASMNPIGYQSSFQGQTLAPSHSQYMHPNAALPSFASNSRSVYGAPQHSMYAQSDSSNFQQQNTQQNLNQGQIYGQQQYREPQQHPSFLVTSNVQQQQPHFSPPLALNPPVVQSGGYAQRSANLRTMTQFNDAQNFQGASSGISQYDRHTQQRPSNQPGPNFHQFGQQGNQTQPGQSHQFAQQQQHSQQHQQQPQQHMQYQQGMSAPVHQGQQQQQQPVQYQTQQPQPSFSNLSQAQMSPQHSQYQQGISAPAQQGQQQPLHYQTQQLQPGFSNPQVHQGTPQYPSTQQYQFQEQQQQQQQPREQPTYQQFSASFQNEAGTSGTPSAQPATMNPNLALGSPLPVPSMPNQQPAISAAKPGMVQVETVPETLFPTQHPPPSNEGSGVDARAPIDPKVDADRRMKTIAGAPGAADGRVPLLQSALVCDLPNFIVNQVLESPKLKGIKDPAAAKVHGVELLKLLIQDPGYGMKFEQILSDNPNWKKYQAQDHSLFITGPEQRADYFLTDGSNGEAKKLLTEG